jgi:hypothetical protein
VCDRVALDDVSFGVGYDEVFGFLGSNSAGLYLRLTVTENLQCFAGPNYPTNRQEFSVARDGTRVPVFTASRKDANVSDQNL